LRLTLLILLSGMYINGLMAQNTISGTVLDSSRINFVPGVKVINNAGHFAITDSMGRYTIDVAAKDSLAFVFNGKSTIKFPVQSATDPGHFDISLRVPYKGKFKVLKEVIVQSKSYREDSIENRQAYAKIFNYQKPSLQTSVNTSTGMVGADVNEIINLFRFKRNKSLKKFQSRLEEQEEEKYVNYRFNKTLIKRITHLEGEQLTVFMLRYRPSYDFASNADELIFNQYILNCYYYYKAALVKKDAAAQ
jgi:hypothetical protein